MSHEINTAPEKQFAHESIAASEMGPPVQIDAEGFPWLDETTELNSALVTMKDKECPPFLVASAIGTNDHLINAARGMSEGQRENTDNMFWSRIGNFIKDGYHSRIETMPDPATKDPVFVMRNKGGQRVYFAFHRTDEGGNSYTSRCM